MVAYIADKIFTGDQWLYNHAVVVHEGHIQRVIPVSLVPNDMEKKDFPNFFIAPAFIDLQNYGAKDKLFSVYPSVDALNKLVSYCASGGAVYCLPTLATNTKEIFYKAIDAVREYWQQDGKGVLGLHLEGPWINPIKRGAHIESLIHSPSLEEVKELLAYGGDVIKIITLAPEVCDQEIIKLIVANGIVVSAGHSNATYEQANTGFVNGITTVTHLFNAMSPLQHRQPGLAGAVMDHSKVMSSIIPDGHHVDYAAVRIAKKVMRERLFVITDAVTTTTEGAYQHYLDGDKYEAAGILSGSALTMDKAIRNLVEHCGIELEEALRMCSLYPAQLMGLDNSLGKIEAGYKTALVIMGEDLRARDVISL